MTRAEILARLRAEGIEPGEGDLAHLEVALPALAAARAALRDAAEAMAAGGQEHAPSPSRT